MATTHPWRGSSSSSPRLDQPTLFEAAEGLPAPVGELVRLRLTAAYDGRGFSGFAANPGVRTVGGTLVAGLERVLRHRVELTCAGRTDAGVHAWGQVVSFDARADVDLVGLQRSVNRLCGPAVVVRSAEVAEAGFDARFSARARRYRYTILNSPVADPFLVATAWHVRAPLDLAALRLASDPFMGEHDFASFCRKVKVRSGEPVPSTVRRVLDTRWHDLGDGLLRFDIEANAFCHQMVRSIVGIIVEAGTGKRRAGEIRSAIDARSRRAAGAPAPAHGLCLWEVVY